ncbi:hypothetical protein ABFS82_02G073100 [Erythranthe guttata]
MIAALSVGGDIVTMSDHMFYTLSALLCFTYAVGYGIAAFVAHNKVKRVRWAMIEINNRRTDIINNADELEGHLGSVTLAEVYNNTESPLRHNEAQRRLSVLKSTLNVPSEQAFQGDHMKFLVSTSFVATSYLVAVMWWNHKLHTGSG